MTDEELAFKTATGLVETGIEGGFDNVECSTAYDSLCVGVSSWEQGRGQYLISTIPGAEKFLDRPYSDLDDDEIEELSELLDSEEGRNAQMDLLSKDCLEYVVEAKEAGLRNEDCIVYACMWMPTSTYVVSSFILKYMDEYDLNDIDELHKLFYEEYAIYAACSEYLTGYRNRATATYKYLVNG